MLETHWPQQSAKVKLFLDCNSCFHFAQILQLSLKKRIRIWGPPDRLKPLETLLLHWGWSLAALAASFGRTCAQHQLWVQELATGAATLSSSPVAKLTKYLQSSWLWKGSGYIIPSHSNYCRSFIIFPLLQICVNSWGLLQSNRHKAPPPFLKLMGGHASAYPECRDGWHTFKRAFTNPIMPVCFEQVRC